MAYEFNPSDLFNPVLWSDLGLQALDMTVASSQNLGEGVDRLTRAAASFEAAEDPASSTAVPAGSLALSTDWQRSTFDMLTQAWLQWMSTIGTFASIAAGLGASLTQLAPQTGRKKAAGDPEWAAMRRRNSARSKSKAGRPRQN